MTHRSNRRLTIAGLVAGLAIGAVAGVTSLIGAAPNVPTGPRPVVLHVAKVLAEPGADLELSAGLVCPHGGAPACQVTRAVAHVLSAATDGWVEVDGEPDGPGYRFVVPGSLVPDDGISYWLELVLEAGGAVRLPEGGPGTPFRVVTTAGLQEVSWPGVFDWSQVTRSDGVVAQMGFGRGAGQVGRVGGSGDEQALGPSSFDVGPDGSIHVADWVNGRVLVLSSRGELRRTVPLPVSRPVDIAIGTRGDLALTTLGLGATAFELRADGAVVGRYEVASGVAERIAVTAAGPRVWVGPAQWTPVRSSPGVPLPADAQAKGLASAVPARDGGVAVSQDLEDGRVAFVWARPDGSRAGAVLELPTSVQPGVDHFVRALPDGGAIAARGLWDESHEAVALLRFAADGTLSTALLIPAPTREMDAAASAVRFREPDQVLAAYTDADGIHIDRFEVRA
jgi:hypothetical protein